MRRLIAASLHRLGRLISPPDPRPAGIVRGSIVLIGPGDGDGLGVVFSEAPGGILSVHRGGYERPREVPRSRCRRVGAMSEAEVVRLEGWAASFEAFGPSGREAECEYR